MRSTLRHALLCSALLAATGAGAGEPRPSNEDIERSLRKLLVASPYRIPDSARAGTIRFRVQTLGAPWAWPETHEQHVRSDGATTELTICADCGKEEPPSAEALQRYLAPNAWVTSRDRRVIAFARAATGGSVDSQMNQLVLAVQRKLNGAIDFRDYGSATDALLERSGDCTEFAILLAAAARARHIPTRVVAGVSYASHFLGERHSFSPHMWVQAWDGQHWKSYDAALGKFDAAHIAISIGDGTPDGFRGEMQAIARLHIVEAAGIVKDAG
ncbi:MAG TPA: transglutaminase domain-containing protein [Dokdonella sp.]|nr:transglutaminase domain-containing protein [Dokdonella sp.]